MPKSREVKILIHGIPPIRCYVVGTASNESLHEMALSGQLQKPSRASGPIANPDCVGDMLRSIESHSKLGNQPCRGLGGLPFSTEPGLLLM